MVKCIINLCNHFAWASETMRMRIGLIGLVIPKLCIHKIAKAFKYLQVSVYNIYYSNLSMKSPFYVLIPDTWTVISYACKLAYFKKSPRNATQSNSLMVFQTYNSMIFENLPVVGVHHSRWGGLLLRFELKMNDCCFYCLEMWKYWKWLK